MTVQAGEFHREWICLPDQKTRGHNDLIALPSVKQSKSMANKERGPNLLHSRVLARISGHWQSEALFPFAFKVSPR
jgi:hypothetical protein